MKVGNIVFDNKSFRVGEIKGVDKFGIWTVLYKDGKEATFLEHDMQVLNKKYSLAYKISDLDLKEELSKISIDAIDYGKKKAAKIFAKANSIIKKNDVVFTTGGRIKKVLRIARVGDNVVLYIEDQSGAATSEDIEFVFKPIYEFFYNNGIFDVEAKYIKTIDKYTSKYTKREFRKYTK